MKPEDEQGPQRSSSTNWERVDQMTDEDIDTSDIPPLDNAFWTRAKLRLPRAPGTDTQQSGQ